MNPWVGVAQKGHNEVQHMIFIFLFLEAPLKWDLKLTIGMYLSEGQNDHLNASEKKVLWKHPKSQREDKK